MARAGPPVHGPGDELASIACRPAGRLQCNRIGSCKLPPQEHEHTTAHRHGARRAEIPIVAEATVEALHQQDERSTPGNVLLNLSVGCPTDEIDQPVSRRRRPFGDELTDRTEVHVRVGDHPAGEPGADLTPVSPPDPTPHQGLILFGARRDDEHQRPPHLIHLEVAAHGGETHPKVPRRPRVLVFVAAHPAAPCG
jgi:hypothetical protein